MSKAIQKAQRADTAGRREKIAGPDIVQQTSSSRHGAGSGAADIFPPVTAAGLIVDISGGTSGSFISGGRGGFSVTLGLA